MRMISDGSRSLTEPELRQSKPNRTEFLRLPRNPVTIILDGVHQAYNIGAIFRLCDAFLVERIIVCGFPIRLDQRRLVQAAAGTQGWVPWAEASDAVAAIQSLKAAGYWTAAVELTIDSVPPRAMNARFPATLVLGAERLGVSPEVLSMVDRTVAIPMRGMASSLNVATAAAIMLHELTLAYEGLGTAGRAG